MTSFPNVANLHDNCPKTSPGTSCAPTRLRRLEVLSRVPMTEIRNGTCMDLRQYTGKAEGRA